jgi:hypothetical protein
MMENARRVVSNGAPAAESVAEGGKKIAGKPKRGEHKRKRLKTDERGSQLERMQLPNLPTKKEQAAEEAKQQQWIKFREAGSKYRGVSWKKRGNKWIAAIKYDGKQHSLGYFKGEEEAARAYDRAARAQHGDNALLNFPAEGESGSRKSSKYRGVSWNKRDNKWTARIRYDGKGHYLGCFEDEEEAARSYDRAAKVHKRGRAQLNFSTKQRNLRKV